MLSPPVIVEELSICSTSIRLRGQLSGARVEVYVDGNPIPIADAIADWPDQWFGFRPGAILVAGQSIRARQSKDGDTSVRSTEAATVQDRSTTQPLFVPPLVGCSTIAVIQSLAPGATVHVRDSSNAALGDLISSGSRAVVPLTRPVNNGETLKAFSEACGAPAGSPVNSLQAELMRGSQPHLETPTLTQAMECQRILVFGNTRVGALLYLQRNSGVTFWTCSANTLHGRVDPPLVKDEDLVFWQEPPTRACEVRPSPEGRLRVNGGPPGPPRIATRPCPGSRWIRVEGLVPTATVKVLADGVEICVFEAADATQEVDLGNAYLVPGQRLTVVQGLCGVFGPPSPVPSWVTKPALSAAPKMPEELYECATVIRVVGLAGATRVSLFSDKLRGRIGFGFAEGGSVDIPVSPPLTAPDRIHLHAEGCASGFAERDVRFIRDVPPFQIVDPVEDDTSILLRELLPGSRVDVSVDLYWAGGSSCGGKEHRVSLTKPLKRDQKIHVSVRLCSRVRTQGPVFVKAPIAIHWTRPTMQALQMNTGHYMSGRVQAAIPLESGSLLLGTEEGGLWVVSPGGTALPLSFDWNNPLVRCLARGTRGPQHIYCGTNEGLMESETAIASPILLWRRVNGIPNTGPLVGGPGGVVNDVLVLESKGLIFVATNVGIWWSPIPATSGVGYVWTSAAAVNSLNIISLCEGPSDSIVGYGAGAMGFRFVRGEWSGSSLQWANTTPGVGAAVTDTRLITVVQRMANGRVASCATDRSRVVAALADATDNAWLAVLRSEDGGKTWSIPYADATLKFFKPSGTIDLGFQADRNLCLLVHANDKRRILLAARRGGLLGSSDDGITWKAEDWPPVVDGSFHADQLCIVADKSDVTGNRVIVGSDGGVFVSTDFGKTWDTSLNRMLTTLMFDQQGWSSAPALSASEQFPGLMVGAFQDNGKAYLSGDGEPWRELGSVGDGQRALFVTGDIVLNGGNDDADLKWARWDGSSFVGEVTLEPPNYPANTQFMPFLARVSFPSYSVNGALMIALAGDNQPSRNVFGLFDRGAGHAPASERLYWLLLGNVPFAITAIGSLTGHLIVVGTGSARIYLLDPSTGTVVEMTMPPGVTTGVVRWITAAHSSLAFSLVNNSLLRTTDMMTWHDVPTLPAGTSANVIGVDRAVDPPRLILAGSHGAWSSRDLGATWTKTSGLPVRPHANHLEVVNYSTGQRVANLGTWNLSVWRAELG